MSVRTHAAGKALVLNIYSTVSVHRFIELSDECFIRYKIM